MSRLDSIARADTHFSFGSGFKVSGDSSSNSKSEGSLEVVTGCVLTARVVSRVSLVDGGGTASEVGGTGISVAPSDESGGDLGTWVCRIRACRARFFTKSWMVLGATETCKCSRKKTAISWNVRRFRRNSLITSACSSSFERGCRSGIWSSSLRIRSSIESTFLAEVT
jgi:hypothetical protein